MTMSGSTTIRDLLSQSTPEVGRFEAFLLLGWVLNRSKTQLITHELDLVEPRDVERFRAIIQERLSGKPVPYITGHQEFFGLDFLVNEHTLIPRPDTETIVELALERLPQHARVLELGTGSGCIAITLVHEKPTLEMMATDISSEALAVARTNAQRLKTPVEFREGSWFEPLTVTDGPFDMIVSNPPYIHAEDEHLKALTFEPYRALTDEADGLRCLKAIIEGTPQFLKPQGYLLLEHGYDQGEVLRAMMEKMGFKEVKTVKDLGNNDRVTLGQWP